VALLTLSNSDTTISRSNDSPESLRKHTRI